MLKSTLIALSFAASTISFVPAALATTETATATIEPARLKLAEQVVGKLIPPGTYQRLMKDMADQMANGMIEQLMGMNASAIATAAGDKNAATDGKTLGDLAKEKDPKFQERMDITMKVMFEEMGKLMNEMEPIVRTAMSSIYAKKYSAKELTDMNVFFASTSGAAFANNFMSSFTDKEMMQATFGMMPKMMESMPDIMKKVETATAHLPPVPKSEEADAAAVENPFANETGDEPWYDGTNWTTAQRTNVAKLSDAYIRTQDKNNAAYEAYEAAENAAVDAARKRFLANGWKPEPQDKNEGATAGPADGPPAEEGTPGAAARPQ
jgi:hypothetical protein